MVTLTVVGQADVAGYTPLEARPEIGDHSGLIARRYDGQPGTYYLLRPDQHVVARWRRFDQEAVTAALRRATGQAET